jgi:hypothetical protein
MAKVRKNKASILAEITINANDAAKRLLEISASIKALEAEKDKLEVHLANYYKATGEKRIGDLYQIIKRRTPVTLQVTQKELDRDVQQEKLKFSLKKEYLEMSIALKKLEADQDDPIIAALLIQHGLKLERNVNYSVKSQ